MDQKIKKHFVFTKDEIAEGKYNSWDIIQPLWYNVSIYDGIDVYNKDLEHFTDGQRKIFALNWYASEVSNGGHDQFFFNSTGIVWKDAIEGMHMIGAEKIAENFQKAIDMFGGEVPFDRQERVNKLEQLSDNEDFEDFDDFEAIDDWYYDNDAMDDLMDEYVKNHPEEFVVDGEYDYYE